MKDYESAFPVFDSVRVTDYQCIDPGMNLRRYAAIKLKVPRSGDPDIDAMIRESRRAGFAERAMGAKLAGILASSSWDSREIRTGPIVKKAFAYADAMLAEWEKAEPEKASDYDDSDEFADWEKG
jgi:hypothetical protein